MKPLRPHQQSALALLRQSLGRGNRRPMVQAPTGFGKTVLASHIVSGALAKGNRVIFVVPSISLIDQTVEAFHADGITSVGVMQGIHEMTDPSQPVQVASIQTIKRRRIPDANLVVVDEAHRWFEFMGQWMARWDAVPFVGLSATPWTKGLGKHYDDLIVAATTDDLIREGYLSKFRVFAPSKPDLSKVRTVAGDYHEGDLAEVMNQKALVADLVSTWKQRADGRPTLVFGVDRAHAKAIQADFQSAGITCGYIDAYTDRRERGVIAKQFNRGELQVVANVGCLTTGVDWDVRCIVLARPTKSEILFTQIIGRGLRTAEGKQDCIARDSLVLTDKGEVKIQDVTLDHKVWDGVEFVEHSGAVCRGVQPVVSYDGLTATPDHRVMTDEGWETIAEAARRRLWIARTGVGGRPIRFAGNRVEENGWEQRQAAGRSEVRQVRADAHGLVSQHSKAAKNKRLPSLQWARPSYCAQVVISTLSVAARSLQQSAVEFIRSLWGERDTVSLCLAKSSGGMDCGEFGDSRSKHGRGSDRQRRALRAGESALGASRREYEQHAEIDRKPRAIYQVQRDAPGSDVCGQNSASAAFKRADGRRDYRAVENAIVQAQREVWDILNAGPLQRFTANGRLVHNCLILDHSDTHQRLGFVTDIHHEKLCDGKPPKAQERKERLPKECPQCTFLLPVGVSTCPACGFKPEVQNGVEHIAGELEELGKTQRRLNKAVPPVDKALFYAELRTIALERGYAPGWASNQYRVKFGVWPNAYRDVEPMPASAETRSWVKSQQIRYAKRRSAA